LTDLLGRVIAANAKQTPNKSDKLA